MPKVPKMTIESKPSLKKKLGTKTIAKTPKRPMGAPIKYDASMLCWSLLDITPLKIAIKGGFANGAKLLTI